MRRGFEIEENKNVLFVEDVITTGKSSKECLVELKKLNINLLGIACIVDRSSEDIFSDHEIISLIKLDIPVYDEKDLPNKLKSINPIKPGSRII
jgi:orotate phosphoribosyltransferase